MKIYNEDNLSVILIESYNKEYLFMVEELKPVYGGFVQTRVKGQGQDIYVI